VHAEGKYMSPRIFDNANDYTSATRASIQSWRFVMNSFRQDFVAAFPEGTKEIVSVLK
jgi:hypothetical protein